MPKVGSEYISNNTLKVHITLDIHFNKKTGFYVKLPDNLKTIGDYKGIFNSQNREDYGGFVNRLKEAVKKFWIDTSTPPKKVILYDIKRCMKFDEKTKVKYDEISFARGMGLTVDWVIRFMGTSDGKEIISNGDQFRGYENTYMSTFSASEYRQYQVIDWTQELDDFFMEVDQNIKNLIIGITMFFGDSPGHLIENITNNRQKLLGIVPEMKVLPEWKCTDPDADQWGRQLSPYVFEFRTKDSEPVKIDLEAYSHVSQDLIVRTFYPDGIDQVHREYGENALWIVAECIYESEFEGQ